MSHNVIILGASGYTGAELVRLIATHPSMNIVALSADRKAGLQMGEVFPHLRHLALPKLQKIDEINFNRANLVFCALPHATSQAVIRTLPGDIKVVDLSADFRLRDPEEYARWYGKDHAAMSDIADAPTRWIAADAMKFTAREIRRGNRYDAIVLDPPKFGRGPKNETWRFEEDLPGLLANVRALLSDQPLFVILTAYAVRLSHIALAQALSGHLQDLGGQIEMGEMALPHLNDDRLLPTSICARWTAV